MSKKLKKWQMVEIQEMLRTEKEQARTKYIINSKIKEIKKLKKEIEAYKELNKLQSAIIQALIGKSRIGKYISKCELSEALKCQKCITTKNTKKGYRLRVE